MIKKNRDKKCQSEITSQNSQDQLSQASEKQHTSSYPPINQKYRIVRKSNKLNDDESEQD
ncbi:24580_t:CDS:2 [Dentiscutata erythropus]|uniref:24580_t:CDS:1 n=1 Tax=Dentiscutata erythropus TaxID=1348616 RepID=A0A9N8W7X4_9GLOM|nr:24580_t:CDS:2 [Dentiscutata erythropus]